MAVDSMAVPQCRACMLASLEYNSYTDLEASLDTECGLTFLEGFNLCTRLDAQLTDTYPKHLCASCATELMAAYEFMRKAETADKMFKSRASGVVGITENIKWEEGEHGEYATTVIDDADFDILTECDDKILECTTTMIEKVSDSEQHESVSYVSSYQDVESNENSVGNETHDSSTMNVVEHKLEELPKCQTTSSTKAKHVCIDCDRYFSCPKRLDDHLNVHKGFRPYECDLCSSSFFASHLLTKHMKLVHNTQDEIDEGTRKTECVKCIACGKSIEKRWYRQHLLGVHSIDSTVENKFLCDGCPRQFPTSSALRSHIANRHTEKTVVGTCETCGKAFTGKRSYERHLKVMHQPNREKLSCSICNRKFAWQGALTLHMKLHFGGEFECRYCDKTYTRQNDLDVHMRFHTGDWPFKCEHCDKRYAVKSHLTEHVNSKHLGVVHKCNECGAQFKSKASIRAHRFVHTSYPFPCPVCGNGFTTRFKLRRHLKHVHKAEYTDSEFDVMYPKRNVIIPVVTDRDKQMVEFAEADERQDDIEVEVA